MKEIDELVVLEELKYAEDHEWARKMDQVVRVGISDYAQDQLGDITFVELPEVGDVLERGEECGTLESTKAVSELYLPLGGEIVRINEELEDTPGLINTDCYGKGWILELKPDDEAEFDDLLSAEEYLDLLKGMD